MITEAILEKVKGFPLQYQQEIVDFIDFIEEKKVKSIESKKRKFGSMKGIVTYMSPDFDEPLDDFKEYM